MLYSFSNNGSFLSILKVNLTRLRESDIANITCGTPEVTDTIMIHDKPRITELIAIYAAGMLTSIHIQWKQGVSIHNSYKHITAGTTSFSICILQKLNCGLSYEVNISGASVPLIHHEETLCKRTYCTFDLNYTTFSLNNVTDEYQLSVLASNEFNLTKAVLLNITLSKCQLNVYRFIYI